MVVRRLTSVFLVLAALALALPAEAQQAPRGFTPELALETKRIQDVRVSPDGSWALFVVSEPVMDGEKSEWISRIHAARLDGADSYPLTRGERSSRAPRWSPDGRWIAFLSERSEPASLYRIRLRGGEAERLTEEEGAIFDFRWSPDGSRIAFTMRDPETEEEKTAKKEKRDAFVVGERIKHVGLYVLSLAEPEQGARTARRLSPEDRSVGAPFGGNAFSWSPDGGAVAFSHAPTPKVNDWTAADLSLVRLDSGEIVHLAATAAAEMAPVFSPDGQWIAYSASDDPPTWAFTSRVHLVSPDGRARRALAETPDQQPQILGWSSDGQSVLFAETERTLPRVFALPAGGGAPVSLSPEDLLVGAPSLNDTGTHLGFVAESFTEPPEAFASVLSDFAAVKVSEAQDLPELPIGKTEVITWRSTDGQEIEGLLTYPVGYEPGTQAPLLVIVHGGPTGVFVRRFIGSRGAYLIASFAEQGYAVLRANVRGSSGYGRAFRYANYADWGGGDYRDLMSGVDHVIEMGVADPNRLGIMGWSYGGFMTSWVITQTDRFKAASVGAGVTHLASFTGTADIPGFIPDYFGGELWEVFERWTSHSPLFHVGRVSTPTLIQHGEEDRRVPITQAYELYNALERRGVPVKMVVYPRQPHGIQEPKLLLDAMKRNLEWFGNWIPAGGRTSN